MKKMTKKIVAIVTMMMFIVTMMPFAAFAGTTWEPASLENSSVALKDAEAVDGEELPVLTVTKDTIVDATTVLKDENGLGAAEGKDGLNLTVNDNMPKKPDIVAVKASAYDAIVDTSDVAKVADAIVENAITAQSSVVDGTDATKIVDSRDFTFKAAKTGTYYILIQAKEGYTVPAAKLVVKAAPAEVGNCKTIVYTQDPNNTPVAATENNADIDAPAKYNGVAYNTITAKFYDEQGNPAVGEVVTLTTDNDAIVLSADEATTDYNGKITFKVRMTEKTNGKIYLQCEDGLTGILSINAVKTNAPADIEANNTGIYVAATSKTAGAPATALNHKNVNFTVTDKDGAAVVGKRDKQLLSDGNKGTVEGTNAIAVVAQPTGSKLTGANFAVKWNKEAGKWELVYDDAKGNLKVGDYKVTVALANGASTTAEFSVGVYDKTTAEYVLKVTQKNDPQSETLLGQGKVGNGNGVETKAELVKVDANGIEVPVNDANASYAVTGKAVGNVVNAGKTFKVFATSANGSENDLIGTEVTVQAYDKATKTLVEKTFTVVQEGVAESLAFVEESGDAQKNNTVNFNVVDENGDLVKVKGTVFAKVLDKSNEDAKVTATAGTCKAGKGTLKVYASEATTADIQVVVYNDETHKIIAGTLKYTFGQADVDADKSVVMTIGDKNFVVNNKVVTGDAAPYVANDRTYVPIRALAESFSADVDWDNDARTVTITRGDAKVVMTVDKTTYTVNGKEATMDVAPEITGDRTYVPVRFVAEALGFTVTPFYAADGTTGSVLFQI